MAIFIGDRLVDNDARMGSGLTKTVKHLTQTMHPDWAIKFTVVNYVTATPSNLSLTGYSSSLVVISIKRGYIYISKVYQMNSFSVDFEPNDEVTILGRVDILSMGNSIHISDFTLDNNWFIRKVYVKNNSTLTTVSITNTGLVILDMRNCSIYSWTATNNYSLYSLYLTDNPNLITLDMSQMKPGMGAVYINRCGLTWATTTLAVTSYSTLEISENPLGILDLTLLTGVKTLRAHYTGISVIDFSTITNTGSIRIDGNNLTQIDTSTLGSLYFLRCHNNPITSLDFTNNVNLQTLACTYTKIATLDFTTNPLITSIEYIGGGTYGRYLTNIIWGATNKCTQIRVDVHLLPVSEINNILVNLDANGLVGTECRIDLQLPNAPPSGAGITAKANLISKGWTNVVTD